MYLGSHLLCFENEASSKFHLWKAVLGCFLESYLSFLVLRNKYQKFCLNTPNKNIQIKYQAQLIEKCTFFMKTCANLHFTYIHGAEILHEYCKVWTFCILKTCWFFNCNLQAKTEFQGSSDDPLNNEHILGDEQSPCILQPHSITSLLIIIISWSYFCFNSL